MLFNKASNEISMIQGKKVLKYICKNCNTAFYGYNDLCTNSNCNTIEPATKTDLLYILADCFSYANGKPGQFAGYTTIVTNDRFDLPDKYNIEYINRKAFDDATNNFGELMGILDGLQYFINEEKHEVYSNIKIISDSQYVIFGADHRMYKWRAAGWKNTSGEVKNKEVWIAMMEAVETLKGLGVNFEFIHQKGHVGKAITKDENPIIYLQEKCDTLSTELKEKILKNRNK